MTDLTARQLLIDLDTPPTRHWCADDAFLTALFNALSMSFPIGEQFFIDSLRAGVGTLPDKDQAVWKEEIRGFVAQEATHRQIHKRFNDHLYRRGLINGWERRIQRRLGIIGKLSPRHHVAITAAYEHFTSIMSDWILAQPQRMAGTEPRLQQMWLWHASEEIEHRHVAFDVYKHMDGDEALRKRWMRRVTLLFLVDVSLQTLSNLRRDGSLWRRNTWRSAWKFLLARGGLFRDCFPLWKDYFKADFHPQQHAQHRSAQWLAAHRELYRVVGEAG
jgi:predicted metal-dependent hydrolase